MLVLHLISLPHCARACRWADEFDGTVVDESNWSIRNGSTQDDSFCRDAMCLADNVAVRDGNLVLTAKRETRGWANFTTGAVDSQNKKFFAASAKSPIRVCISGQLPGTPATGAGYWPALWLMPNDDSCWPDHGEIDLMEEINGDGVEHFTYHVSPRNATICKGGPVQEAAGSSIPIGSMATAFHEYAAEISLGQFSFVVDSKVVWNSANTSLPIHDVPWYAILNFAIGGPWPKPPTDATIFPAEMFVDYVRVAQLA